MALNADFLHDTDFNSIPGTVATGGINAGEFQKIEDTWGLAYVTALAGVVVNFVFRGVQVELPKSVGTGLSFTAGDICWLDTSTKLVHKTFATGNVNVGIARKDAGISDTHVLADFNGRAT